MSRIVAQFDPSAGSGEFSAAAVNRCSALLFMNESANFITLDFSGAFPPMILQPWSNRLVRLAQPVQTVNWTVSATLNSFDAPVSQVYVEAFDPSEDLSGIISGPLLRQTNVGNSVSGTASSVVNDGSPTGTNVLEATPTGSVDSFALIRNDGTVDFKAVSSNVETDMLHITPGDATHAAKIVLQLLQTLGALSLDNGKLTTDGAGNLTALGSFILHWGNFTGASMKIWNPSNTDVELLMAGTPGPGNYNGFEFWPWENGAAAGVFGVGSQVGGSVAAFVDGAGVLHAPAPIQLISGHQETGFAGFRTKTPTVGDIHGEGVNFKTVMDNTPTSIGNTIVSAQNTSTVNISNITKYGFSLEGPSTSTAGNWLYIEYTTVGNCLLAVDSNAGAFDQHCEGCGALHRGTPVTTLAQTSGATPAQTGLSFTCPDCGYMEHFNCGLSATDEADTAPQGSGAYATTRGAQATLIRQLMTALGLEVAP